MKKQSIQKASIYRVAVAVLKMAWGLLRNAYQTFYEEWFSVMRSEFRSFRRGRLPSMSIIIIGVVALAPFLAVTLITEVFIAAVGGLPSILYAAALCIFKPFWRVLCLGGGVLDLGRAFVNDDGPVQSGGGVILLCVRVCVGVLLFLGGLPFAFAWGALETVLD